MKRIRNHRRRLALLIVLVGLVLAYGPTIVQGQSTIDPGIDLIILLDQSGSMSTFAEGVPPADPDNRRVDAARYLMQYLAFDNNLINPQRVNRVAVIGFGTRADLTVGLTRLDSQENLERAQSQVRGTNLGWTSFISAFRMVREVFPPPTDVELEDGRRQRIIVLITDGGPFDPREWTYEQYFSEIEEFYLNELGWENYPLYVVGIDDTNVYWGDTGAQWNRIASPNPLEEQRAFRVRDVNELNTKIIDFLCPFLGQTGVDRDCRIRELGYHFVEPYAYRATFSFFKYRDDAEIALIRPDESTAVSTSPKDPDLIEYLGGPDTREELYVFDNPIAGCWKAEQTGEGRVDVHTEVVFQNFLQLTSVSGPHSQLMPLSLVFQVTDANNMPVREDPKYPIRFEAVLVSPDNNEQDIEIQSQPANDGEFYSTNDLQTPVPGNYEVSIAGYFDIDPNLDPTMVNCEERGTHKLFEATFPIEVYTPGLRLLTPEESHLQYTPLDRIEFGFLDRNDNLAPLPANLLWTPEVSLASSSGNLIPLSPPSLTANGTLEIVGPLILSETGDYVLNVASRSPDGMVFFEDQVALTTVQNIIVQRPPPEYPPFTSVMSATVQLHDMSGNPASPDPNYPLRLEASLIDPDGDLSVTHLESGDLDFLYTGQADWILQPEESYRLLITGYMRIGSDPGSSEQIAFVSEHDVNGSINLPYFRVIVPDDRSSREQNTYALHGGFRELFQRTPLQIEAHLLQGESFAVAADLFQNDINNLFEVVVTDDNGAERIRTTLKPADDGAPGKFVATLDQLAEEGDYQLLVRLNGVLRDGTNYQGFIPDKSVEFQLIETALYKTVRTVAYILAALTVLIILAYIFYCIWQKLPPYPRGRLVIREQGIAGKEIASLTIKGRSKVIVLYAQRAPFRIKLMGWLLCRRGTVLPVLDSLKLQRIEIRRAVQTTHRQKKVGIELKAYNQANSLVVNRRIFDQEVTLCNQVANDGKKYQFNYST